MTRDTTLLYPNKEFRPEKQNDLVLVQLIHGIKEEIAVI